jgi:hypothetical protein
MNQETQRRMQRCQLNHWKKDLILKFGATEGARIHQNAFAKYEELLNTRNIPSVEILDKHLIYMILPLLALYEGLLGSGVAQFQALEFIAQLNETDDVSRCFIYDTLKSYGREELTQFLCKTDDYLYESIAPCKIAVCLNIRNVICCDRFNGISIKTDI